MTGYDYKMNEILTITAFVSSATFFIFAMNQTFESDSNNHEPVASQQFTQKVSARRIKPIIRQSYPEKQNKIRQTQGHNTLVYKTISKTGKVSYSNSVSNLKNIEQQPVKTFSFKPSRTRPQGSTKWLTPKPQQKTINHVYIQRNYNQPDNDKAKTSLRTCRFYKKKFDWFSEKMRRGYTNSERDWLESNRVKYRDLLFWNCDSHKLL